MSTLTNQEMFNRAVTGLRSQGFARCLSSNGLGCAYSNDLDMHCAWGWVDQSLVGEEDGRYVSTLADLGIGLAKDIKDLNFVVGLQKAHDEGKTPADMESQLHELAETYHLTWPEEA